MLHSGAFGDERGEFMFENMEKCEDGVISGVEYLMGVLKEEGPKVWLALFSAEIAGHIVPHLYALSVLRHWK